MKSLKLILFVCLITPLIGYSNIVYVDNNDMVYPFNSSMTFNNYQLDINSDGYFDINLSMGAAPANCDGSSGSRCQAGFSGLVNTFGQNYINGNGLSGVQYIPSFDCTNDTLNILDTWSTGGLIYKNTTLIYSISNICGYVGIGNHKQGFRLLVNSAYYFGYIDYTLTNTGDVIIHGWYYEDTPNVPIVANSLLDYPYNGGCIYYDTVVVYDTIEVYDYISVTDTLIINTSLVGTPSNMINTIKIYPNPTSTHIYINNGDYLLMNGYSIKIISSGGQEVFNQLITQQEFYIDITQWGSLGLYYVNIIDNLGNITDTHKILLE